LAILFSEPPISLRFVGVVGAKIIVRSLVLRSLVLRSLEAKRV